MQIPPDVYRKIVEAKLFIDENFQESLDLKVISRKACLSRFHFHRLFTRIYNRTPHEYLTFKRIDLATQLLKSGDSTVQEICNQVGFESIGSFSSLFKKRIGLAPHSYRNRLCHKRQQSLQQPLSQIPHCFVESFARPS
jgi:AraC-like DNA-binding protein